MYIRSSTELSKDGEGDWFLFVKNDGDEPATLINFRVTFYGTEADPQPGVPNFVDRPQQKVRKCSKRWGLVCMIPHLGSLWPQVRVHTT